MSAAAGHWMRPQIEERRRRLEAVAARVPSPSIEGLLAEVDAALQRLERGEYGLCETCHDPIEPERLRADPLTRFCIDHLSEPELRAHEQDLELATRIQGKLLPQREISAGGWHAHYHYQSAGPVGGDYCEIMPVEDGGRLFFAIGDVSGKGVAASLLMTHLSAILRSLLSVGLPIPEMMTRANRLFCESTLDSHYATLICGRVTGSHDIELACAGHCPPLVARRHAVERLDMPGLPLGLFVRGEYPVTRVALERGDSLILYTDGVTEARNPAGIEFGEERLTGCLEGGAASLATVLSALAAFRGATPPADDVTLLVIRRGDEACV